VTLRGGPRPAPGKATLDQRGCRFIPHVQVVPVGSQLDILNGDAILHGVHGWVGRATTFNLPMPEKGERVPAQLVRAGLVQVRCDVHAWMSAYVLVADGPAAVAAADGSFTLREVPAGTYTLTAWHERLGELATEVKVPEHGVARVELSFAAR
jgi:hypothetical protein